MAGGSIQPPSIAFRARWSGVDRKGSTVSRCRERARATQRVPNAMFGIALCVLASAAGAPLVLRRSQCGAFERQSINKTNWSDSCKNTWDNHIFEGIAFETAKCASRDSAAKCKSSDRAAECQRTMFGRQSCEGPAAA